MLRDAVAGPGAINDVDTKCLLPPDPTFNSEAGAIQSMSTVGSLPPSSETLVLIKDHQRIRQFCIKSQSRIDRSCEAFLAPYFGYRYDLPEKKRKAVFQLVASFRISVENGKPLPKSLADREDIPFARLTEMVVISANSRRCWDNMRDHHERDMKALAKSLSVYAWTKAVRGFGELGLAVIVAETTTIDDAGEVRSLSDYATKERVWKRLGLAVIDDERQQKRKDKAAAEAHGYMPRRRAEIWAITDSLFKHQWKGETEDTPAHPVGPYGYAYAHRKAYTEGREGWTDKHRDNDARRVMSKFLIENLWRVWNGNPPLDPPPIGGNYPPS